IPLSAIAHVERQTAPLALSHQEQFPSYTVSFDLPEGKSLDTAVAAISAAEKAIGMPDQIQGSYSGEAEEFRNSLQGQPWLIL
ncbi:efflux RND transporter permease subunit, partial [Acinetobacter baumannii]